MLALGKKYEVSFVADVFRSWSSAPEVAGSTLQDWTNAKEASSYDHIEIAVPYSQRREKMAFQMVLRVKCKNLVYSGLFIHEGKQGNMDGPHEKEQEIIVHRG